MRLLLQRVTHAEVRVGGRPVGRIGPGLLALVAIGREDDSSVSQRMADKVVGLRIFRDGEGATNRSLQDSGGELLAVSQFSLYADTSRGRRPSFIRAGTPAVAEALCEAFCAAVERHKVRVARGIFGAEMEVELVNDGPITIWIDSQAG